MVGRERMMGIMRGSGHLLGILQRQQEKIVKLYCFFPNNQGTGSLEKTVANGSIELWVFRTVVSLGNQP